MIGYDIAQSYSDSDGFSGRAGVPGPQLSNELHGVHAPRSESFVSPQSVLVHHENREDASSAPSLNEEMVQSKLHSGYRADEIPGVPSASSVQKTDDSGQRHPFELLLRDSQNSNRVEGVSFPTVKDFKHFVEILKSSYLIPGGDLTKHFQTAREMMAKEAQAQYAQAQLDAVHRAADESGSVYGWSENEVHSEPQNTALFEQSEQGGKYQMASKSSPVSDPVDSALNLISTSLYDKQDLGQPLYSYAIPRSAAKGFNVDAYEGFDNSLFSGEKPIFTNGPNMQQEDERDVQSDKIGRGISADARSKPFNSYSRSIQVSAPKRLFNISDYLPKKPRERPTLSFRLHPPNNGKQSKDVNETPTVRLQLSDSSVSSESNPLPRSRTSQGDTQSSSPQNSQNEVLNRKQPIGSHYTMNGKRTNNRDVYLEELPPKNPDPTNQEPRVHNALTPNSAGQHSTQTQTYIPVMGDDANFNALPYFPPPVSSQTAFSRLYGNGVLSSSFGFKSANPSRSPPRGIDATGNMLVSFLNQQRGGFPLNRASVGAIHAGILQNFMKHTKFWNHPHSVGQRFGSMAYQPPGTEFLNYATSGGNWPNDGKNSPFFPRRRHGASASPENLFTTKSRRDSVSGGDPWLMWQERTGASHWKPNSRPKNDRRALTQTP